MIGQIFADTALLFGGSGKWWFMNILTNPHADFCLLLNTCINMAAAKLPNRKSTATRASFLWTFRSSAVIRTSDRNPSSSFTNNSHWPGEHGHSSPLSILRQELFPSRLRETSYWMFAATPLACWWRLTEKWVRGAYLDDGDIKKALQKLAE